MTPGIVICSRLNSKRIPRKPLVTVSGKAALRIVYERLSSGNIPIRFAFSDLSGDLALFEEINRDYTARDTGFFYGHAENVLARFLFAAEEYGFDPIVRITHDDILQDPRLIEMMVKFHQKEKADYTYIRNCVRGMDCEVVSLDLVRKAWKHHGDRPIEHLSYAFRNPSLNPLIREFTPPVEYRSSARLSLDYPEDLTALRLLFRLVPPSATGPEIVQAIKDYPEILEINRQPLVTVYTCAYNAEETIYRAAQSVLKQDFKDFEYIIVDDGSYDKTTKHMIVASADPRVKLLHNEANLGLATSCNIALNHARGTYAIRLDADDELLPGALTTLVGKMQATPLLAAVYPAYFDPGIVRQNTEHHMGGTMIKTAVWQELRFCDGLRHWEGKEFYRRLSSRFHVEHSDEPTWIYHQREKSLSRSEPERRKDVLKMIGGAEPEFPLSYPGATATI